MLPNPEDGKLSQDSKQVEKERRQRNFDLLHYLDKVGIKMTNCFFMILHQMDNVDYSKQTHSTLTPAVLALKDLLGQPDRPDLTSQEKAWLEQYRQYLVIYVQRMGDGSTKDILLVNNDPESDRRYFEVDVDGEGGDTDMYNYGSKYDDKRVETFIARHSISWSQRGLPTHLNSTVELYDFITKQNSQDTETS